jgi:hypothetical protein
VVSGPDGTNPGEGLRPETAVSPPAEWSSLPDDELAAFPEALRPFLVKDQQGNYDVTGFPAGWTVEQRHYSDASSRTGCLLAFFALAAVGAVVTATVVWGKAGAFGSLALIFALLFAWPRSKRKVVRTELTLKPPAEPQWSTPAGMPISFGVDSVPAPVVLETVTPGAELFSFPRALMLAFGALLVYYGVITLTRAASMMSAAQHDRLLAVGAAVSSLLSVWLLIWFRRNFHVTSARDAEPVSFGQAAKAGVDSWDLLKSLADWLQNRIPPRLLYSAAIVFSLATGVAVATSAFYPVPAVTSGWRIGTGVFELAGVAVVVGVAMFHLVKAAAARQGLKTWFAVQYLLASAVLLLVAYWLGMLNHALDSLQWIVTHLF